MYQYLNLLSDVLTNGVTREDRTGVGTRSIFGAQLRFDLSMGFPLVTTKKVHFKSVMGELLWFISGSSSANELREKYGVTIWDEWADRNGDLGPVYGKQWRDWEGIDQLASVVSEIKTNPNSRRLIVSAWNPVDIPDMALPPCHVLFQFYVADGRLSCSMYQRSADVFLGLPFNIASYALLTHMVAQVTDLVVGDLVISLGDVHLYNNHVAQAREQLARTPRALPYLWLNSDVRDIDAFTPDDIRIGAYNPWPAIKAEVAV